MSMPMNLQYVIVYWEILLTCIIIAIIIILSVRDNFGTESEVMTFRWLIVVYVIALLMDAVTHAQYRGVAKFPNWLIAFFYSSYMFLFSGLMSYFWFLFAESKLERPVTRSKNYYYYSMLPVILVGIMSYLSPLTGWYYSPDADGIYTRGPLWVTQSFVAYGYFLFTAIHAMMIAKKERSVQKRRQDYILASFIIAPFFGAIFQLIIGNHPFVAPTTCFAIIFIFINLQNNMIYSDTLTGLNNRKRCDAFLEDRITQTHEKGAFYLFMLDIDNFKSINDTYGHLEGDKCLKMFGGVLRSTVDEYQGFVGRFGGDEFITIIDSAKLDDPEDFMLKLNNNLEKCGDQHNKPYALYCSLGYSYCDSPYAESLKLINAADEMLYKNKKKELD